MSSLPPVGGTKLRSRFAISVAPIVSLVNRRFAAPVRCHNRGAAADSVVSGNRLALALSSDLQSGRQTCHIKFGNCALAAAAMQAAA